MKTLKKILLVNPILYDRKVVFYDRKVKALQPLYHFAWKISMTEAMKKSNRPVSKKEDLHFKVAAVKLELVN